MDLENLSKTDLILTAVFLSFITAIVTGIVLVFLMEDTPEEIIRDRIISTETSTSTEVTADTATTSSVDSESIVDSSTPSRDEILDAAVNAVARITAENTSPQAGVLVELSGREVVITNSADYPAAAQALFENGTVADLESSTATAGFSTFFITAAADRIYPLSTATSIPEVGASAFVVPLSERPEIVRVSITAISGSSIETSASSLPKTSLLLGNDGRLIGLFQTDHGSFQFIGHIQHDM